MKRIVLCFDGTWNKPADENLPPEDQVETNVRRFFNSVHDEGQDGTGQVKWYDQGIGSHWYDHVIGGTIGLGLETNIFQGYRFLAESYEEGDEVYILGFSRGAYTARSLVGMIRNCGLVKKGHLTNDIRIAVAYGIYRTRGDHPDSLTAKFFRHRYAREIDIQFVGVWDTVGALGIPLDLVAGFNLEFYEFHDTQLSKIVRNAYHAIAVDEHRKIFDVCLWGPTERPEATLEQRWFVGSHCDVGGGYPDRRLADVTLRWMQDQASALGLALDPVAPANDVHHLPFNDAYAAFLEGRYAKLHGRHLRSIGTTPFGNEVIDESVRKRQQDDATYTPQNQGI